LKRYFVRLLTAVSGLFLFSVGIVLTIKANIGYPPWDVFHVGVATTTGLSLGAVVIITGLAIIIIVAVLGEKPGPGTILNMILIGIFIDILFPLIPMAENQITGTMMLIAGIPVIAVGSYLFLKSAFGVGPRDGLMVVLTRRTKLPVGLCRCAVELFATAIGWIFGGMVGVGTVIFVILIGPCIQMVFKAFKFDVTAVKHETLRDTYASIKAAIFISCSRLKRRN